MTDQLRILDVLGDELERATAADERTHGVRRRRHWRPHGLSLVILIGGVSAAGVAAAATNLFGLAAPVPAPRPTDAPIEARPLASTAQLAGVRSGDPDGFPAWDVRVSRSRTGELCTAVGQIVSGKFGIVGLDRQFRELPLGAADACGQAPDRSALQVGARAAVGRGAMTARTLVVGIAGPDVERVALVRGRRETPLAIGHGRAFLAVLEGLPDLTRPRLAVTDTSGKRQVIRLSDSGDEESPDADPSGLPWAITAGPARNYVHPMAMNAVPAEPGAVCVQGRQQLSSALLTYADHGIGLSEPRTPVTCRPAKEAAPLVATMRRLSPSNDFRERFVYGLAPARTIAMGLASDAVERVELRTPAGPRAVELVGPRRAFLVVLDGRVNPESLELRARLRDGRLVVLGHENAAFLADNGRSLKIGPSPPWRDATALAKAETLRFARERRRGSQLAGPPARDPAGGPDWAAFTWLATTDRPNDKGAPLQCAAFGPLVGGVVREPHGASAGAMAAADARQMFSGCTLSALSNRRDPTDGSPAFYGASPSIYIDDPARPDAKIVRVTLTGVYPGVVRAEALGLPKGRQVPATVGPRGAVLAMLGPEAARPGTNLRLRLHFKDGATALTGYSVFTGPRRRITARAVDPKGGPPWGVQAATLREPRVPALPGQIVDGRPGRLIDRTGELMYFPGSTSGRAGVPPTAADPVWFEQQQLPDETVAGEASPADVARRTLPGRTVIYGAAAPGVKRVTIQTPRDVRTVRPSAPGGFFIVAYDGRFTQGRIRVIADGPSIYGRAEERADGRSDGSPRNQAPSRGVR